MNNTLLTTNNTLLTTELKQLWVQALRSGKYQQGHGCLRTVNNTFCCLGVLADVINPDIWKLSDNLSYHWSIEPINCKWNSMWLMRYPISIELQQKLAELNDTQGYDFQQIADWIEVNL